MRRESSKSLSKSRMCVCMKYLISFVILMSLSSCEVTHDMYVYLDDPNFTLSGLYEVTYSVQNDDRKVAVNVTRLSEDKELLVVVGVDEVSDTISTSSFYKVYDVSVGEHVISMECGYKDNYGTYSILEGSKMTSRFRVFENKVVTDTHLK